MKLTVMNLLAALLVASTIMLACSRDTGDRAPHDSTKPVADTAAVAANAAPSAPSGDSTYVGLTYETPPAGVTTEAGSMLPKAGAADFDLGRVHTPKGDRLWLESAEGKAKTVRAELKLPPLANDERLFIASCDVNGKLDPSVAAIVVNEAGATKFTKIRQAWRAHTSPAHFDVLAVTNISCEDPGG